MSYFIMVNDPQGGGCSPLLDEEDNLELFDQIEQAIERAEENRYMKHFGYEIFERGDGVHSG